MEQGDGSKGWREIIDRKRRDISEPVVHLHCGETMETLEKMMAADSEVSVKYGLWFSQVCTGRHHEGDSDSDSVSVDKDDDIVIGDDDEGDDDKIRVDYEEPVTHKKHRKGCHCEMIRSDCFFETYGMFQPWTVEEGGPTDMHENLDIYDLGSKLTEHRVEATIAVVTCFVGLVLSAIAFKNANGRRCFAVFGIVAMLISCTMIFIPLYRFGKHNVQMVNHNPFAFVLAIVPPYSLIFSAIGGLLCFITMVVIAAGLFRSKTDKKGWFPFHNDMDDELVTDKKPTLVLNVEQQGSLKDDDKLIG